MARLVLAVIFVAILLIGGMLVVRGLRAALTGADQSRGFDLAENGMMPRISYALLVALILYVTLWGGG